MKELVVYYIQGCDFFIAEKVKCVIIDNDVACLERMRHLCEDVPYIEVVGCFSSPLEFVELLPGLDFEICLIELNMPLINGIKVAEMFNYKKQVVFMSGGNTLLKEAFSRAHADVVGKPFDKERFNYAVWAAAYLYVIREDEEPLYN